MPGAFGSEQKKQGFWGSAPNAPGVYRLGPVIEGQPLKTENPRGNQSRSGSRVETLDRLDTDRSGGVPADLSLVNPLTVEFLFC